MLKYSKKVMHNVIFFSRLDAAYMLHVGKTFIYLYLCGTVEATHSGFKIPQKVTLAPIFLSI